MIDIELPGCCYRCSLDDFLCRCVPLSFNSTNNSTKHELYCSRSWWRSSLGSRILLFPEIRRCLLVQGTNKRDREGVRIYRTGETKLGEKHWEDGRRLVGWMRNKSVWALVSTIEYTRFSCQVPHWFGWLRWRSFLQQKQNEQIVLFVIKWFSSLSWLGVIASIRRLHKKTLSSLQPPVSHNSHSSATHRVQYVYSKHKSTRYTRKILSHIPIRISLWNLYDIYSRMSELTRRFNLIYCDAVQKDSITLYIYTFE